MKIKQRKPAGYKARRFINHHGIGLVQLISAGVLTSIEELHSDGSKTGFVSKNELYDVLCNPGQQRS